MTTTAQTGHPVETTTHWSVDAGRTSVDFAVKTFWGLLTVRGHFDRFGGSYEAGPDGTLMALAIDADSIDTGNAKRDEHLRSSDFFAIGEHPEVRFTSTRARDGGDGLLHVEGELEAAGRAVPLALEATIARLGDGELEIEATTTVDQRQLGMSSGLLGMIRRPATLHVRAVLSETAGAATAKERS